MSKHNFRVIIPTHILLNHFDNLQKQLTAKIRECRDFNEHLELVGQLKLLGQLENLPETLTLIEQHDEGQLNGDNDSVSRPR